MRDRACRAHEGRRDCNRLEIQAGRRPHLTGAELHTDDAHAHWRVPAFRIVLAVAVEAYDKLASRAEVMPVRGLVRDHYFICRGRIGGAPGDQAIAVDRGAESSGEVEADGDLSRARGAVVRGVGQQGSPVGYPDERGKLAEDGRIGHRRQLRDLLMTTRLVRDIAGPDVR